MILYNIKLCSGRASILYTAFGVGGWGWGGCDVDGGACSARGAR